jgi:hypothetical protein
MNRTIMLAIGSIMFLSSGCIVLDHQHPGCVGADCNLQPGEIRFYWGFELEDGSSTDWCNAADVTAVDLTIYDAWGDVEFEAADRPCDDMGAIIDNFFPDDYDLQLVGICSTGEVTHEGYWTLAVDPGLNDYGTLVLDYLGPCE